MGAVFRARDTRLGRDVAIKVLLPEGTGNPERLARFQREAQVLAALNHPNIAAIYGLESIAFVSVADGTTVPLREAANVPVARISPDGRWVAYEMRLGGSSDVFVRGVPGAAAALRNLRGRFVRRHGGRPTVPGGP
jgi:eukaryotic-like serine/threonine-protein kinase